MKTLPPTGGGVQIDASGGVPDRAPLLCEFAAIPKPIVLSFPTWPERRIRVYVAAVLRCARRHEYRVTAGELARDAGVHLHTARRALRELEACGALAWVDAETDPDGRRMRFAWLDWIPAPALEVTPKRGPDRRRRRGASGTGDPWIIPPPPELEIPGSPPWRSLDHPPPYPDPSRSDLTKTHPSDLSGKTDAGAPDMDGRMDLSGLLEHAKRMGFGVYEAGDLLRWLEGARSAVAAELGVCPLPGEWETFARATWADPTIPLGSASPLAVALCRKRVLAWFRVRYRPAHRPLRKRATGAPRAEQSPIVSTAEIEAFSSARRRPGGC